MKHKIKELRDSNTVFKRWVLRWDFKVVIKVEDLTVSGKLFHSREAAMTNSDTPSPGNYVYIQLI